MTPRTAGQRYADMVATGEIHADPAQMEILAYLDELAKGLRNAQQRPWWKRFFGPPAAVKGLYLWGRVGRGKTLLTEVFLEDLGDIPHQRWHFHRFMNHVHQQLAGMPPIRWRCSLAISHGIAVCWLWTSSLFPISATP